MWASMESLATQPRLRRAQPAQQASQREQGDGAAGLASAFENTLHLTEVNQPSGDTGSRLQGNMGEADPESRSHRGHGEPDPNSRPHRGPDSNSRSPEVDVDLGSKSRPFSIRLEVDLMQLLLTVAALMSRTWHLGLPRAVVFDELHFAKFVSLYMKRLFFFDVHPPLGKMLLALAGSYAGFEGDVKFERIGAEFPPSVPVEALRVVPAVLGSLVVPLIYQIAVELHLSRWAALVAAGFVLLDNALLVQSRFMLMEGMLLFFSCLAVMAYLKFRNVSHRAFSVQWWMWLCVTGISFTCCLSIKYSGTFTALLIVYLAFKDYWTLLDDTRLSEVHLVKDLLGRVTMLLTVPVLIYLAIFYAHLSVLTKAGPHDNVMTSAFQASLEGGLAALTKGQPLQVAYGSQITLRHSTNIGGNPCWLHSHSHVYPMRYPDGRGSSHQQQVTCYVFKDVNNWWIVKHPDRNSLVVDEKPVFVKHGDIVQLVHGITTRALNSHDVAAPVTPQNQEVSCYIDYNVSMPAQNLWRVEIVNRQGDTDNWQTIQSQVRLVHVNTTTALRLSSKQLPEWGFHQLEVTADRHLNQPDTIWNVEEHRYSKKKGKSGESSADVRDDDLLPLAPTQLSFWSKFWELQWKMLMSKQDTELEHKFSSTPSEWPLMARNIAYWMSPHSNAQIHLVGNLVVWWSATLAVLLYLLLAVVYYLCRQRAVHCMTQGEWKHFIFVGELLVGGYLLHYLPYFSADRTLFLHHYLPAVPFKVLVLAALLDHLATCRWRFIPISTLVSYGMVVLISAAVYNFLEFVPVSLGNVDLAPEEIQQLTWRDSWDFLLHSKV